MRISYRLQKIPKYPTHLRLNLKAQQPIEVIDAIAEGNGKKKTLTGNLVKFPESPQLQFDVYAIEVKTQGVKRYFTLVNFEDIAEFEKIRDKLAQIWDSNSETAILGRNMLINTHITLEVNGQVNVVSPEQANPQILLNKAEDINQKLT